MRRPFLHELGARIRENLMIFEARVSLLAGDCFQSSTVRTLREAGAFHTPPQSHTDDTHKIGVFELDSTDKQTALAPSLVPIA